MSESDNNFTYKDSVSLKEYFEEKISNIKDATKLAADLMNTRLHGMNDIRNDLQRQSATFVSRQEFNIIAKSIEEEIKQLRDFKSNMQGKASQSYVTITLILAVMSLIMGFLSLWMANR